MVEQRKPLSAALNVALRAGEEILGADGLVVSRYRGISSQRANMLGYRNAAAAPRHDGAGGTQTPGAGLAEKVFPDLV